MSTQATLSETFVLSDELFMCINPALDNYQENIRHAFFPLPGFLASSSE
jgi:hypothetical protein